MVCRRKAFSLVELLVVIAVMSLLISLVVPSLQRAKELTKTVVCVSNLRGIGSVIGMYTTDHKGTLPPQNGPGLDLWYRRIAGVYTGELQNRADGTSCLALAICPAEKSTPVTVKCRARYRVTGTPAPQPASRA